jgi:hypothetical protein
MGKWPKEFPPLSPEDKRICDDFMEHGRLERFKK